MVLVLRLLAMPARTWCIEQDAPSATLRGTPVYFGLILPSRFPTSFMVSIKSRLLHEWQQLTAITPSERPWQLAMAAALAAGLPLVLAAALQRPLHGIIASMGGLAFLYVPSTTLARRMKRITACALGMGACYALGLLSHHAPRFKVPMLPGQWPWMLCSFALGTILACLLALFYSLYELCYRDPEPSVELTQESINLLVFDSVIVGASVAASLALAHGLHLEKPYWVPVACLAVIRGNSMRAVWNRQVHRIIGTALGLGLAWAILSLSLNAWLIALLVTGLMFLVEVTVVRQYAVAVMFITPLGILLAEAAISGSTPASALMAARFCDTLLGALAGFFGGMCLHNPRLRPSA